MPTVFDGYSDLTVTDELHKGRSLSPLPLPRRVKMSEEFVDKATGDVLTLLTRDDDVLTVHVDAGVARYRIIGRDPILAGVLLTELVDSTIPGAVDE